LPPGVDLSCLLPAPKAPKCQETVSLQPKAGSVAPRPRPTTKVPKRSPSSGKPNKQFHPAMSSWPLSSPSWGRGWRSAANSFYVSEHLPKQRLWQAVSGELLFRPIIRRIPWHSPNSATAQINRVTSYMTSVYVIDFKRALRIGEAHVFKEENNCKDPNWL